MKRKQGGRSPALSARFLRQTKCSGVSLVELILALGLVTFCLVALLGLFQAGLSQERVSTDQTRAAHIQEAVADAFRGEMRIPAGVTGTAPETNRFGLKIPVVGVAPVEDSFLVDESGSLAAAPGMNAYAVHYAVKPPAATDGAFKPYLVRIIVAWPGTAQFQGAGSALVLLKSRGDIDTSLEMNRE